MNILDCETEILACIAGDVPNTTLSEVQEILEEFKGQLKLKLDSMSTKCEKDNKPYALLAISEIESFIMDEL